MVAIDVGLSELFFCGMAYKISEIVLVQESFDLGKHVGEYRIFVLLECCVWVSVRVYVVPGKGAYDRGHVQYVHDCTEK